MIHYKEILKTISPEKKIEFLEQVLSNSSELQSQFVNYFTKVAVAKSDNKTDFNQSVAILIEEYKTELENLDLEEPDYDRWTDRNDRYYEEWEIDSEIIEQEVSELFDDFSAEIVNNVAMGEINLVLAQLTALLIACETADVDDPYDNLGGNPNESFLEYFDELVQETRDEIIKTILNADMVSHSIFKTAEYFENKAIEDLHTESIDVLIEGLLQCNIKSSHAVYAVFNVNKQFQLTFPISFLETLKTVNPDLWLGEAEKASTRNVHIAKELLTHQSANDLLAFHTIAKKLFGIFPNELIDIIAQSVDPKIDSDFTKEIYRIKINKSHDIELYKKLALLLTDIEKHDFIEQYKHEYSGVFYVKLLEQEGQFEQILNFAQKYNGFLTSFSNIMEPIIHKYPEECFKILQPKIQLSIDQNINRQRYAQAAEILEFLVSDVRNKQEVTKFATALCQLYPRRSALRDEFRQAKLIAF